MKRFIQISCMAMMAMPLSVFAQQSNDSLWLEQLQEVVVKGVRVQKDAPYAVANFKKAELQTFSKTGRELPFLFAQTPGILAWSENGVGTGTSYLRIRGAGDSRINVTLDGVPLNSPEDECVFWANMNSYASLLGSVQIQRGVGASTNGDGAFGGTVALGSKAPSEVPAFELTGSYGSFNTFKVGGSFSTGLLWNHLIFDGAYHETNTDGYVHGTSGRSGSYYGGLTWLGNHFVLRYKNFGNFEKTGQAWNGVTAGNDDLSLMNGTYGVFTGIKTYKDMYKHGLGKFNSLYEALDVDGYGFTQDENGNYLTHRYRMNDGSYWDKTTDNFYQNHNILSAAWDINPHWTTNASLHYTYGYGYYKEFRPNNKLKKFGLSNFTQSDGTVVKRTDFVRRKGLTQNAYGLVWNANYKDEDWDIIGGISCRTSMAVTGDTLLILPIKRWLPDTSPTESINTTILMLTRMITADSSRHLTRSTTNGRPSLTCNTVTSATRPMASMTNSWKTKTAPIPTNGWTLTRNTISSTPRQVSVSMTAATSPTPL